MRKLTSLIAAGLFVASAALVGCSNEITADSVRSNMTPELETIAMTREQRLNQNARAVNTTGRQIHDDWDRIWLIDRPLRLSEYTIP